MRRIPKVIAVLLLLFETLFSPGLVSAIEKEARANGEPGYWCYGDPNSTTNYEKFTMVAPDGKESIVYCYDHDKVQPVADKEQAKQYCKYERFGFYDGMENLANNRGDQSKVNKVAAALMVGYPNNGLGAPMNKYAEQCYKTFMETLGSRRDPGYSIEDFKREMTQAAIWQIDKPTGRYINKSPYAKAIYDYANTYPLDESTAYAKNVKLVDEHSKEINSSNPLVIDPDTLKTQLFSLSSYNGIATLDSLPSGYKVIDNSTKKEASGIVPNQKYYIEANSEDGTQFEVNLKIMTMRDSYFYQSDMSPWDLQNMVSAKVTRDKFKAPIILVNKPVQDTEVSIEKVDSDKTSVNGAELTITNAEGKKVDSWTTDGTVHKVSLANGEYTLTETKVPKGYKKADPIQFTVKDGQVLVNQQSVDVITMIDKKVIPSTPLVPAKHKVVLSKQNVAGEEIAGAELTLTTGGKQVDSWTSEAGKNHEFFVDVNQEYTLTETRAPEGYEIAESITFRVTEAGKVEIKNGNEWKELKDNKVIMVDEYKKEKPTKKLDDKKDLGLIVTDNSNNFDNTPHNNNGNEEGSKFELPLPQTGNKQMKYLPVVGGVLLVIAIFGLMLGLRRKQK